VEHLASAHSDAELALLLSTAPERLAPGLDVLDLGDLPSVAPRIDSLADWTADRRAGTGQSTLEAALTAATPKETTGGRPLTVNAGGGVVGTSSLLLWQVLPDGRWCWPGSWSPRPRRTVCGYWPISVPRRRVCGRCSGR
jgi:hypothetical protein